MARIVWSPKALDDLEELLDYIAKDAPMAARRFAQKMFERVEILKDHPLAGSFVTEDESRTYRELVQGNYRIIYRFDLEKIYLVAVHHAAQLLDTGDLG